MRQHDVHLREFFLGDFNADIKVIFLQLGATYPSCSLIPGDGRARCAIDAPGGVATSVELCVSMGKYLLRR